MEVHELEFDLFRAEDAVKEFESIIKKEVSPNHSVVVHIEAMNTRVNADISKDGEIFVIQVMGGMVSQPEMNADTLKLLLCHEIGHLLGGPPLKSRNGWSSTEGQADYYSAKYCARVLGMDENSFLDAALNLTEIYARVTMAPAPSLNSCDSIRVERTNYGYPTVQCRLDTLVAGWQGLSRPSCWFRE